MLRVFKKGVYLNNEKQKQNPLKIMKTYTLDHNTGSFSVTEELQIKLDGQDMLNMGWEIENDKPEDQYVLTISDKKISASILCSDNDYHDSGFTFEYIDTIQDLIRHGYLIIANEDGDEVENGTLQIMP